MNWYLLALKKYADFKGRSRRKEYWMFVLFNTIFAILAMAIDLMIGSTFTGLSYGFIYMAYGLFTFIPGLSSLVRRLHDTNRSGWWFLIALIPIVGAIILLVFLCTDSTPGENKWGPNPKNQPASFDNEALDGHLAN